MNTEPESPQPASAAPSPEASTTTPPTDPMAQSIHIHVAGVNDQDHVVVSCADPARNWHQGGRRRHWLAEFSRDDARGWRSIPHVTGKQVPASRLMDPDRVREHTNEVEMSEAEAAAIVDDYAQIGPDALEVEVTWTGNGRATVIHRSFTYDLEPGDAYTQGAHLEGGAWRLPPCKCGHKIAPIPPAVLATILDTLADNGLTSISLEALAQRTRLAR